MSLNNNVILGEITSGTDCFLIGRHSSGGNIFFSVFVTDPGGFQGMLSVGTSLPVAFGILGGYTVVTPTVSSTGVTTFVAKTLANGLTAAPTVISSGYVASRLSTPVPTQAELYWSAVSTDTAQFKMTPIGNNVPTNKLYAGVWYNSVLAASGAGVNGQFFTPAVPVNGWSGEPAAYANPTDPVVTDLTLIPRSVFASVYNASACTAVVNAWDLFTRFDAWVRYAYMAGPATYEQSNCSGILGSTSANCLFIGTGCNGSVGYTYCTASQTCANGCFGMCSNGKNCTYDPILAKWFCPPDCDESSSSDSSSKSSSSSSSSDSKSSKCVSSSSSSCSSRRRCNKPWWKSWWFMLIVLFAVLLMLFFAMNAMMK